MSCRQTGVAYGPCQWRCSAVGERGVESVQSAHLGLCAISAAVTFVLLAEALREGCRLGGCGGVIFVGDCGVGDLYLARALGVPR